MSVIGSLLMTLALSLIENGGGGGGGSGAEGGPAGKRTAD